MGKDVVVYLRKCATRLGVPQYTKHVPTKCKRSGIHALERCPHATQREPPLLTHRTLEFPACAPRYATKNGVMLGSLPPRSQIENMRLGLSGSRISGWTANRQKINLTTNSSVVKGVTNIRTRTRPRVKKDQVIFSNNGEELFISTPVALHHTPSYESR